MPNFIALGMIEGMSDKVWFITGTSSGFGRAIVEAALERGDRVFATARNIESISDFTRKWPDSVRIGRLDVMDAAQTQSCIVDAMDAFGRLDVLVNNAGYGLIGAVEEASDEQIRRNFEVNFFGALSVIRCALPHFRSARNGHVVNISAAASISNYAGFGIYGAAKCAMEGMSESLALEGKSFGLKVTIVQPGPFRTEFISRSIETVNALIPEYQASAGRFAKLLGSMDGKQPGDPVRAAKAILKAVDSDRPPLRLVLGKYAIDKVRRAAVQSESELKLWEDVGLSADGPSA